MSKRISRQYAWSEIQELARDLRETLLALPSTREGEAPRVARVEGLKAHQAQKPVNTSSITQGHQGHQGHQGQFDAQAFKDAWRAQQDDKTSSLETPYFTETESGLRETLNHPESSSLSPNSSEQTSLKPSSWDLLRDHFIEQRRIRIARAQREQTKSDTHQEDE